MTMIQTSFISYSVGLHRPFNKPLKSLVWVCRFAKYYRARKNHDFYLDFFLWMLTAINKHRDEFDEEHGEGIIKPQNASIVLGLFSNLRYDEIKVLVRSTLTVRNTHENRLIYSSYKNTSYYVSLAKKLRLINSDRTLSVLGLKISNVHDYSFFNLAKGHRAYIFEALCPEFFDSLIILTQSYRFFRGNRPLEDSFFRAYLKQNKQEGGIRYITSFDKNYLDVLHTWVDNLQLSSISGMIRKMYSSVIEDLGLRERYDSIVRSTEDYYVNQFFKVVKLELQYERIRTAYDHLYKSGKAEFGFVNLYDIKKSFHLSYDSFNDLLNSYYDYCRHLEIILFSNTVSSIDTRRRFVVGGNSVLKIRIIKKSKYGIN